MTARIALAEDTGGESTCVIEDIPETYSANKVYTIRVGCTAFRGDRGCAHLFHTSAGTFANGNGVMVQGDRRSTENCGNKASR